jgi:hypothetical protein
MKILYTLFFFLFFNCSFAQVWVLADADFDNSFGPLTFSSNGNQIWQIGLPAKPFFDTSYSAPNAIMTDTINPYPVNNVSSIILNNRDTSQSAMYPVHGRNKLSFLHKYQTTQNNDGCAVEVSYNGTTWQNFLADTFWQNNSWPGTSGQQFPDNSGMYSLTDTLFNFGYGFSGTSSGWVYSEIEWVWWVAVTGINLLPMPDSMFIRFTFYSDSIAENLDGWMIDNISLTGQDPNGIEENLFQSTAIALHPQPSSGILNVTIKNRINSISYSVFDLEGRKVLSGSAGNRFSIDVSKLHAGIYTLAIETEENKLLVKPLSVIR